MTLRRIESRGQSAASVLVSFDGLELARRVRSNPRHANVVLVALTGYGQREDSERVYGAGFDRHLVKPVDPAALIRLLHELGPAEARESPA